MPEWLTHVIIGLIIIELFNVKKRSLVLLGVILPDILPKITLLRLLIPLPNLNFGWLSAFHTPFVFFLTTLLIAPIFRYDYKKVVLLLNAGALSHFLSDALLRGFGSGSRLLYPLSYEGFRFNLVWSDQSYMILIPALIIYATILITKRYIK
jgi:membrane-bound metal-dependent hydrolase YbcI (DUF457 family)